MGSGSAFSGGGLVRITRCFRVAHLNVLHVYNNILTWYAPTRRLNREQFIAELAIYRSLATDSWRGRRR